MLPIFMDNNTYMNVIRMRYIDIVDDKFNDVLCVAYLTNNLLSIYQIGRGGSNKTI